MRKSALESKPHPFHGPSALEGTPCPNCAEGTLRRFAEDIFYFYLVCRNQSCQRERLELKRVPGVCPDLLDGRAAI